MKFGQVEREEGPESHKAKNGTPTMGGIVFILAAIFGAFISLVLILIISLIQN